jgi:uncharacterized protein
MISIGARTDSIRRDRAMIKRFTFADLNFGEVAKCRYKRLILCIGTPTNALRGLGTEAIAVSTDISEHLKCKAVKAQANMNRSLFPIIAASLSILAVGQAQPAATPTLSQPPRIISVYGTATVHVAPNLATIMIAVVTQNKDALQAQQENAKRSTDVTTAVKGVNDPALEVSTGGYAITVQHPIEGNVRTTEITGYEVTNSISVKLRDLSKVGEVLDRATLAGANSVNQVSFGLQDNETSRREALSAATADALARVQAIARGLNTNDASPVRFRIIDVSEPGLEYTPLRPTEQMRTFAPAENTPIEAGKMDVTATVCLRAE